MGFNRYGAKMAARASMRQGRPNPMLVTLVYLLLASVLPGIVLWLVGDPMTEAAQYLAMGYDPDVVFQYVFAGNAGHTGVFSVINLALSLFTGVLQFGYVSYALRLARNEGPGYGNLLDGFAGAGRVLWMNIVIGFFSFLWALLCLAPAILVLGLAAAGDGVWMDAGLILYCVLLLAGTIALMAVVYRYRLSAYFLLDDPSCTAREAVRRSKAAMKGHKWDLFVLDLSFLGWILLGLFTMGILYLWLTPYMGAAEANFYDYVLSSGHPASGGYAGPDYDNPADNGPEPF